MHSNICLPVCLSPAHPLVCLSPACLPEVSLGCVDGCSSLLLLSLLLLVGVWVPEGDEGGVELLQGDGGGGGGVEVGLQGATLGVEPAGHDPPQQEHEEQSEQ